MIISKGIRWSGAGICDGRQRLFRPSILKRNLSSNLAVPNSALSSLSPIKCLLKSPQHNHGSQVSFQFTVSPRHLSTSTFSIRALPEAASTSSGWAGDSHAPESLPEKLYPSSELQSQLNAPVNDGIANATPEYIGFLKELGLDYGWGPTSMMQFWLEHVHLWTDLSWVSSVILTAVITRLILFVPLMKASDASAKMREINPVLRPLREAAQEAIGKGDNQEYLNVSKKVRNIQKAAGVKYTHMFLPAAIQIPLGIGTWRTCSGLAHYPIPALTQESCLWITDLTRFDPYFVLPVLTSAFVWLNMKTGAEYGATSDGSDPTAKFQSKMVYLMPFISGIFLSWQPALVQFNFFASTIFICLISSLIRQPAFRRFAKLTPFPRLVSSSRSTGPSRTIELLKSSDGRFHTAASPSPSEDKNALDRLISRVRHLISNRERWWSPRATWQRFKDGRGPVSQMMSSLTGKKALTETERRQQALKERRRRDSAKYENERRGEEEAKRRAREHERDRDRSGGVGTGGTRRRIR